MAKVSYGLTVSCSGFRMNVNWPVLSACIAVQRHMQEHVLVRSTCQNHMAPFQLLYLLPEELLQSVLQRLESTDLKNLSVTSRWCHEAASPLIWREITLTDCASTRESGQTDEHDDTPMLRTLLVLASRPAIAALVHIVNHKCSFVLRETWDLPSKERSACQYRIKTNFPSKVTSHLLRSSTSSRKRL